MESKSWRSLPHDKILELLRAKHRVTRGLGSQVARAMGLSRSAVSQMVNGQVKIPRKKFLQFLEESGINQKNLKLIDPRFVKAAKAPDPLPRTLIQRKVSKADIRWLAKLYEGLKEPIPLCTVIELLKSRMGEQ